jgi:hypothetical protein
MEPFTNFLFSQWNFGYHRGFSQTFISHDGIEAITEPFHELFFLMMESRLSQSLFTNFFLRWNRGYHRAFYELFFLTMESRLSHSLSWNFLSQDGSRISRSLSWTFLSHDGIQAITKPFHEFWQWHFARHILWGKTLFIYITKIIYIGSALLKTLPLDLGLPLQGKEYDPTYSMFSAKK